MPDKLLNQDFGIPKSILSQVTANPDNVSVHKHYLGSDGQIHEGILEERGRSQYAGGVGSGQEDDGTKYVSLNAIPEGVYRKDGKDWAPEVRISEDTLINTLGLSKYKRVRVVATTYLATAGSTPYGHCDINIYNADTGGWIGSFSGRSWSMNGPGVVTETTCSL